MRLMLTKLVDRIIIIVLASAADSVCSSLLIPKNFLSSEFNFRVSLVMMADAMTSAIILSSATSVYRGVIDKLGEYLYSGGQLGSARVENVECSSQMIGVSSGCRVRASESISGGRKAISNHPVKV